LLIIDLLLELLNRRKEWHNIDEIAKKASLSELEASSIMHFLARYQFILLDGNEHKAKVTDETHKFLTEIKQEEKKNSIQGIKRFSPRRSLKSL